ncbi:hypothetical protein [Bartonella refiksaydamii]|uniref:hypothetical protein n=1 Tax=Bartonella refiksaydamii TaxID=2654951 RepID=UPI0012EB782C|nr:hypothetical protein [Bartonella refiksaydamii]
MKKILKSLSGIALCIISGCYSDQTPLTVVDVWEKSGADKLEIKKALLECGIQTFSAEESLRIREKVNREKLNVHAYVREKFNAQASVDACMVQAGFRNKFGESSWCESEKYKAYNLSICQPDAVIPQRSVEIRLNSPYCKENKDQPECQP